MKRFKNCKRVQEKEEGKREREWKERNERRIEKEEGRGEEGEGVEREEGKEYIERGAKMGT